MSNMAERIQQAGIVGAGGAGFPTHVKLAAQAEYVIVNGAECEPLLRVDQQLLAAYAKGLVETLDMLVETVGAKKGIIALKKKYHDASDKLMQAMGTMDRIQLFQLDDFYPAGDEQITVNEVLGRIVPEGGIPLAVNTMVVNVETLLNIKGALEGNPVTDKYVTVTGAVRNPVTLKVPIGVSIKSVIEAAGGPLVDGYEIIDGGPMMGKLLADANASVSKTTKGLIVLPKDHPVIQAKGKSLEVMMRESKSACCQCSLCTEVCPRNLLGHRLYPNKLMRLAGYNSLLDQNDSIRSAFLCCECGLCEQACIMGLRPWKLNKALKEKLVAAGEKNPYHDQPEKVHPFREYRKFPVKRLIPRLGLSCYNVDAPLDETRTVPCEMVRIPLKQHAGVPATATVKEGDVVSKGFLIGKIQEGKLGADIHASINGRVTSVTAEAITIAGNLEG